MDQITPTLLRILGLPIAADMRGAPLEAAMADDFLRASPRAEIASYDPQGAAGGAKPESGGPPSPAANDPLLARLRSLGYLSASEGGGEGPMPAAGGTSANYHANLGISLMSRREYRRAREEFERTLEISPHHLGALGGLLQMDIEEGRNAAALDGVLALIGGGRDFDPVFYYVAAQLYVRTGRGAQGLDRFRQLVADHPRVPQVRTGLGVLLQAAGDVEGAKEAYRASLDLKPEAIYALQELYSLEVPGGDLPGLLRRCDAAAERMPQSILPDNWAALVLRRLGRPVEAEARFRRALEVDPESSLSLVNLSSLLVDTGRADQAVPLLEKAARVDPSRVEARVNLVVALGQLHRLPEARKIFALAGGGTSAATPELLNAMAFACYLNGAATEARALLSQSLTRRPDQAEARRLRARLDAPPPAG
jgi:tetratricopeptide (TPR) repeat protein